jgi:autotransporter-associated beta strand protein
VQIPFFRLTGFAGLILLVLFIPVRSSPAGSATWDLSPVSGDWNTAANWTPATVPNDISDIATFGVSNTTDVTCSAQVVLDSIVFSAGASPFTITTPPGQTLVFYGAGITNNSGAIQRFVVPGGDFLFFSNSTTAGSLTQFIVEGSDESGAIIFDTDSSAGGGNYTAEGGILAYTYGGEIDFRGNAIPGHGSFTINGGRVDNAYGGNFQDISDAAAEIDGVYLVKGGAASGATGGSVLFSTARALAVDGRFTVNGGSAAGAYGGVVQFNAGVGTSGHGSFVANGGSAGAAFGGQIIWVDRNPVNAVYTANGGRDVSAPGGILNFIGVTDVGGKITANGGSNGGAGGAIRFNSSSADSPAASSAPAAQVRVFSNGSFDQSEWFFGSHILGSIEGDGQIFLGSYPLTVGSNNLNTTFSGVIQDGGIVGGAGGLLIKAGNGTLTLSGANTYSGGTIVRSGRLLLSNKIGLAVGMGPLQVKEGTVGGTGTVVGPVTVGTATTVANLEPGSGKKSSRLVIKKALTFDAMGSFQVNLDSTIVTNAQVMAKGVTITNGALINITDIGADMLPAGTVFTLIDNTAATQIAGPFINLADGSALTVGGNTYRASYEGGDGNDLTLTVQ